MKVEIYNRPGESKLHVYVPEEGMLEYVLWKDTEPELLRFHPMSKQVMGLSKWHDTISSDGGKLVGEQEVPTHLVKMLIGVGERLIRERRRFEEVGASLADHLAKNMAED